MYSDVSLANAPRWKQSLMMLHMLLMGAPRFFTGLLILIAVAIPAGAIALAMWLTGASFLAVLPWAACALLLAWVLHNRRRQRVLFAALHEEKQRYRRLQENYSDLKTHPLLPNSIRREIGMPERDTDGVVLINGERFIPATLEDD